MRNLLALLAFALLTFAGVGWYLDWYRISSNATSDGNRRVNIDIHSKKIGEDLQRGSEKLQKAWEKRRETNTTSRENTTDKENAADGPDS